MAAPLLVALGFVDGDHFNAMAALSGLALAADFVSFQILGHAGPCLVCLVLYLMQAGLLIYLRGKAAQAHALKMRTIQRGNAHVQKALLTAQVQYADKLRQHGVARTEIHELPKGHPLNLLHSSASFSPNEPASAGKQQKPGPLMSQHFGGHLSGEASSGEWLGGTHPPVKTISVVLPCAEERQNALNTVERFCQRTPAESLAEIIVVDDGSEPPAQKLFEQDPRRLDKDPRCKLKILRHETTQGLMNAKFTGGKAATGDVIGFFDCHVAPQKFWHEEIIRKVADNPRRMVVPAITDLDLDIFDEKANSAVNAKCYLTFDADFKWFDDESDYIPTISGGLIAMHREWFNLTGGFDNEMHGWGGENLDQSLRAWLCGGEIMRAKSSRIAHMWRGGDSRTASHYIIKARHTNNRGRVVAAWYDAFLPFFRGTAVPKEEVKNYDVVKQTLACKPFSYFLYRFRKMYIEGGVIPQRIFNLREKKSELCLTATGGATSGDHCDAQKNTQKFQLGNVDRDKGGGKCCSGIRLVDSNDCMDYFDGRGSHFYSCDVSGNNMNQHYHFREDGRIVKGIDHPNTCLYLDHSPRQPLKKKNCDDLQPGEGVWEQIHSFEPLVFQTYKAEVAHHRYAEQFPSLPDN